MKFEQAYLKMLQGFKIKRKDWKGYWVINAVTGALEIHLASGEVVTEFNSLTVQNTLAHDWEVVK